MRIIPVIDVMGGVVVRAVAGRRSEYRPLRSVLTESTDPLKVAEALVNATGSSEVYVADLDAIVGGGYSSIDPSAFPIPVLLDAGLRTLDRLEAMARWPNVRPIVGTETWTLPPNDWPQPFPAVLSLDFFNGELRSARTSEIEIGLIAHRCTSIIVLDIARVGTGQGSGTEEIIRTLRRHFPTLELITGGGIKTRGDIRRLEDAGADAVLIASALHDGSLRPA